MRAVVTGGNGFVGRYIVEQLLARGDEVHVIGRRPYPELEALGARCFQIDLASEQPCDEALKGCDAVFHVAAKAGLWGTWEDYFRNNVVATQHILLQARRAGVAKFIYTSSPSVAIGKHDLEGADESTPYPERYLAPYPHTKAMAERHVLSHGDILTVAIRPHLIWGPRDPHIIPRLVERAKAGRLPQIGDGTNKVDVTYVENVADAHILAADALCEGSPVNGKAYFIGQEQPVVLWDFVSEVLRRVGVEPPRRKINAKLAYAAAGVLETLHGAFNLQGEPLLTRLMVMQMTHSHWFDHSAAQRDFGYGPRISTEEGLQRLVAAWQSEH